MKVITSINAMRNALAPYRRQKKTIGFVPTMGFLHEGHLSLARRAQKECDIVVVSNFVNPTQFGPREDFKTYPRDKKRDRALLRNQKVPFVFEPTVTGMYPGTSLTTVSVATLPNMLCGAKRPGHFNGVTTVVAKLFHIVQPTKAYFGQKDYQQVIIIKQMVKDLDMPVTIVMCPIVRERDGLALSSRNTYLSSSERKKAPVVFESLCIARDMIRNGQTSATTIMNAMRSHLAKKVTRIDYIGIYSADLQSAIKTIKGTVFVGVAVYIKKTRLIDNMLVLK